VTTVISAEGTTAGVNASSRDGQAFDSLDRLLRGVTRPRQSVQTFR